MRDQLQRTISLKKTPKRIVSLVPSQTELLCDLGLEKQLVGVTKFCVHPTEIRRYKNVVGGTKTIHIEKLKSLKPDIILCNKEENTKEIVQQCQEICTVHVSDVATIEDNLEVIEQYGELCNVKENAERIIDKIEDAYKTFQQFISTRPSLKVVYFIWKYPWMVAGGQTFINNMLQINRYDNVFGQLKRYPEIDLNQNDNLKEADLILLSSEPFPFKEKDKTVLQQYFPKAKVELVDGEMFSWYGSRLIKSFGYFRTLH